MSQLAFAFAPAPAFGEESFFVSGCNRDAHAWITRWPEWSAYALVLTGPKSSGKTHLAHIWQHRAEASFLSATVLTADFSPAVLGKAKHIIVDDADTVPDPQALLHLLNWLREQKSTLLLTGTLPVPAWPFALPDLRSRLVALPAAGLHIPDDTLLAAVLIKLFADRQMTVPPSVLDYLLRSMERSFGAAAILVERLDAAMLAEGRTLTPALARRVLEG